jgi:hypothetical protein
MNNRSSDLITFYELLAELEKKLGGKRYLGASDGRMKWPHRGVYFFFEQGETRQNASTMRVVRVGTHAVSAGAKSTLWKRLSQHKGSKNGSGNHRGSIFRHHLGMALIKRDGLNFPDWHDKHSAREKRKDEIALEQRVSDYLRQQMPFLWLDVDDTPSATSQRGVIEKNSIVLLAGANGNQPLDAISHGWLGSHSTETKIRDSGLWNLNYVGTALKPESYNPSFLQLMDTCIRQMEV